MAAEGTQSIAVPSSPPAFVVGWGWYQRGGVDTVVRMNEKSRDWKFLYVGL